jgi:hypothetical protein
VQGKPIIADIALLTERRYEAPVAAADDRFFNNILREDQLLGDALRLHGLSTVRVDWSRPDVDWSRFRCAIFRTTWDYFDRFDEFTAWLGRAEQLTQLCNRPSIIRWNMDKHYLADLEARGLALVLLVLRRVADRGELEDVVVGADRGQAADHRMGGDAGAGANAHPGADDREWTDLDVSG